jgi:two pore calcium channel protein 2
VIIVILILIYSGLDINIIVIEILTLSRIIRVLRTMLHFKTFSAIIKSLSELIPLLIDLFGVTLMFFFFFAAIGQILFGGKLNSSVVELLEANNLPPLYIYNNFNDFGSSLIILFELLIVNNWFVQVIHINDLIFSFYI